MPVPQSYELLGAQFGLETTSGTKIAANKKFRNLSVLVDPAATTKSYKRQGARPDSAVIRGPKSTTGTIKGPADYNEGPYLAGMIVTPVRTALGSSGAFQYSATPSQVTKDVPKALSLEWGDGTAARAYYSTYNVLTDLNAKITPMTWEWDGKTLGRKRVGGATLTASPTTLTQALVEPNTVLFYYATTWAGLDAAVALAHGYALDLNTSGWWQANTPASRTDTWTDLLPGTFKGSGKLQLAADADSDTLEAALDTATPMFFRAVAQGTLIGTDTGTSYYYTSQLSFCAMVTKPAPQSAYEGALSDTYDLTVVEDSVSGKFLDLTFINATTAL